MFVGNKRKRKQIVLRRNSDVMNGHKITTNKNQQKNILIRK